MVKSHPSGPRPTVDLSLSPEFPPMGTLGIFLTPLPEESVSLLKGGFFSRVSRFRSGFQGRISLFPPWMRPPGRLLAGRGRQLLLIHLKLRPTQTRLWGGGSTRFGPRVPNGLLALPMHSTRFQLGALWPGTLQLEPKLRNKRFRLWIQL